MFNIILSILFLLPILYYTLILTLRFISPNPLPPTPESLNYLSTQNPNPPGLPLRSIEEPSSLDLSVVIPAYNEENRLKDGLKNALDWLARCDKTEVVLEDCFGNWMGIYNLSLIMVYVSFGTLAWQFYEMRSDLSVGSELLRHTFGMCLIGLHIWTARSTYEVLGNFDGFTVTYLS
ncbi:hypothetical protein DFH28DRAFT_1132185 [Melampsora americana]|nr:hypothetical protein DFH28DRAFT_1132185 [Melampsora americana]